MPLKCGGCLYACDSSVLGAGFCVGGFRSVLGCPGFKPEGTEGEGEVVEGEGQAVEGETREGEGQGEAEEGEGEGSGPIFEGEPEVCTYCNRVVVWMPKRLSAAGGEVLLPISVSSAEEISPSGIDVTIQYDPAFIDPASVTVEPTAITGQMSFTPNTATPGRVRIVAVGQQEGALKGDGHLFDVRGQLADAPETQCAEVGFDQVWFFTANIEEIPRSLPTWAKCVWTAKAPGWATSTETARSTWAMYYAPCRLRSASWMARSRYRGGGGRFQRRRLDGQRRRRHVAAIRRRTPRESPGYSAQTGADPMLLSEALANLEQVSITVSNEDASVGENAYVTITASTVYALSGFDFTLSYPAANLEVVSVARGGVVSDANLEQQDANGELRISLGRESGLTSKATNTILATVNFRCSQFPPMANPFPFASPASPSSKANTATASVGIPACSK